MDRAMKNAMRSFRQERRGLTLIEIILTCFLFLLCVGVIVSTFSATTRTYFQGQKRLELQHTMRTVLDIVSSELREMYDLYTPIGTQTMISFSKWDQPKGQMVEVTYQFNNAAGELTRDDVFVTATVGTDIYGSFDISSSEVIILVWAKNPATGENISYSTMASKRTGQDLLAAKSIGRYEPGASSSFLKSAP